MLKDPDSNPYSLLEGEGELTGDTDASESMGGNDHRRRSRRRRNDQEPSLMDATANESDSQAAASENGLGIIVLLYIILLLFYAHIVNSFEIALSEPRVCICIKTYL